MDIVITIAVFWMLGKLYWAVAKRKAKAQSKTHPSIQETINFWEIQKSRGQSKH